mgnify:CR=1 FL=1
MVKKEGRFYSLSKFQNIVNCSMFRHSILSFLITIGLYSQNNNFVGVFDDNDNVMTVEVPVKFDIVEGYPSVDELDKNAVRFFNLATLNIYDNPKNAIRHFINAINIDPNFVQAYDNLGKAYRMIENYDEAIKCYTISSKIFPNGSYSRINLGVLYAIQNKWDKSIQEYEIAIKLNPNNPEAYYGISNSYKGLGKLTDALKNALFALELYEKNPPNYIGDSYAQVGILFYNLGMKDTAKEYVLEAKKRYIENNLSDVFYNTFSNSTLKDLSIY